MIDSAPSDDAARRAADWLVAIARDRDRGSFILLFTRYAPKVKGYLLRHGVREPFAEELTQETFLAIWRKAGQFDPARASAGAWIYAIARNRWIDALRREDRPDEQLLADLRQEIATPEDDLKAHEDELRLRAAIEALPRGQAEVLRLSFFEGLPHPEIADRMRLPLGTVKSRIRLATAHLRRMLNDLA
ncbi:MAG: sigma-70 family RNA polymerase sigma factor [Caulobacterales bacterium]|jgi:RNA polymerase sigma-70 factor (ECF subfamily)